MHLSGCKYKPVECPKHALGCQEILSLNEAENHFRENCQYRQFPCPYCRANTVYNNLQVGLCIINVYVWTPGVAMNTGARCC